jgi:glycosyltransferase involved in cell wall biosynthesis
MSEISLNMIVRDCAEDLQKCLESVQGLFEEIIIVDTGSKDNTKQVALCFTNKVYDFTWVDDFSKARNYARSLSSFDWTFWLDSDDVMTPDNVQKFLTFKQQPLTADMYLFHYDYAQWPNGMTTTPDLYRERLIRKHRLWNFRIHEVTKLEGNTVKLDISVKHTRKHINSARNIQLLEQAIRETRDVRYIGYLAREYMDAGRTREAYGLFNEFIVTPGWFEHDNTINANDKIRALKQQFEISLSIDEVLAEANRAHARIDSLHQMIMRLQK